jgi:cysteine desulfurase
LPNTANLAFEWVEAEAMLLLLDQVGICASSGSACTSGALDPSHVLTAMGLPPDRARASLRFSLGIYNSEEDISYLLEHLPGIVARLRSSEFPEGKREEGPGGAALAEEMATALP